MLKSVRFLGLVIFIVLGFGSFNAMAQEKQSPSVNSTSAETKKAPLMDEVLLLVAASVMFLLVVGDILKNQDVSAYTGLLMVAGSMLTYLAFNLDVFHEILNKVL